MTKCVVCLFLGYLALFIPSGAAAPAAGDDSTSAAHRVITVSTIALLDPDDHRAAFASGDPALRRRLASVGRPLPGLEVEVRQTDDEAELVSWIHEAADGSIPVVLNPAAFTHYSYALRDAIAQRTAPLVEVHLSNPAAREEFRHTSVVAAVASGTIAGFGAGSYRLALQAIADGVLR